MWGHPGMAVPGASRCSRRVGRRGVGGGLAGHGSVQQDVGGEEDEWEGMGRGGRVCLAPSQAPAHEVPGKEADTDDHHGEQGEQHPWSLLGDNDSE